MKNKMMINQLTLFYEPNRKSEEREEKTGSYLIETTIKSTFFFVSLEIIVERLSIFSHFKNSKMKAKILRCYEKLPRENS